MSSQQVPEAFAHKPDPSEPYRYVCPDCGGQVNADPDTKATPYHCRRCDGWWDKDGLRDKKDG